MDPYPTIPAPPDAGTSGDVVRQVLWTLGGAVLGAVCWVLLSVPSNLINVIFSVLVGAGAGLGAGRLSGLARSARGVALAVVTTAVVGFAAQALITRSYLSWARDNIAGVPDTDRWDGVAGAARLVVDRAAGTHGWAPNASYVWWGTALAVAALTAWASAPTARRDARRAAPA